MNVRSLLLGLAIILAFATQALALPDLLINGVVATPAAGPDQDLVGFPMGGTWKFTLIAEMTPHFDKNTFGYYTDLGVGSNLMPVFDDNDDVGSFAVTSFSGISTIGFFLHNDLNDDGVFNNDDALLFSERALTLPNPPGSRYQWFRAYNTPGYAHYQFDGLDFYGNYGALLFIDDDHVTGPNWDHNDMVVGISVIPEPATLILLGLGLAGARIIARRRK